LNPVRIPVLTLDRTTRNNSVLRSLVVVGAVLGGLIVPASAQFTYPGCSALTSSEFQAQELFNRRGGAGVLTPFARDSVTEPTYMAVQGIWNGAGDSVIGTNIYFVERKGKVKFYDGAAKRVDSVGYIPNWAGQSGADNQNDNGLMGIALDPAFATNKRLYFWYSPTLSNTSANRRLRLSRITLNDQNKLNMSTEKILIDIKANKTDKWHSGGPMTFDAYGDLWVTIGNNSQDVTTGGGQYSTTDSNASAEWSSSNTASLRGGVIRIHPDESSRGYTVPAGNFGEYWANYFEGKGNTALAAQYRDTAKVKPEIYVKGTRSNHSIAVHPTRRWLAWGEVNYNGSDDEFNLVTAPAFTGFPYWHGNNVVLPRPSSVAAKDTGAPTNLSPLNSGVQTLPPLKRPVLYYGSSITSTTISNSNVAIGGPIYVYDGTLKAAGKFPPHLHHRWVTMSKLSSQMWITGPIDSSTVALTGVSQRVDNGIFNKTLRNPLQAQFGPDGALYILNYAAGDYALGNSGVIKISYTGTCLPATSIKGDGYTSNGAYGSRIAIKFEGNALGIQEAGAHEFTLQDVSGRTLFRRTGTAGAEYQLNQLRLNLGLSTGIYTLRVRTDRGMFVRNVSLF
jgi:glucose/arabinose dehydrogenase